MKNFNIFKATTFTLLFGGLCAIFFTSMFTPSIEQQAEKEYSGEDLYRAVFLLSGPVAQQIPEISRLDYAQHIDNQELLNKISLVYDNIIQGVERYAPTYMSELKDAVDTKNPLSIHQSIKKGKYITAEVLKNLNYKGEGRVVLAALHEMNVGDKQISLEELENTLVEKMEKFASIEKSKETMNEIPVCTVGPMPFLCDIIVQFVIPRNSSEEANDLRDERLAAFLAKIGN